MKDGRKETGGYALIFSVGPISYQSKQQAAIAISSTEVEFIARTEARKKALWISQFLATLGYILSGQPVSLKADNRAPILLTLNPEFHWRIEHIEVQDHWIREKFESKEIAIIYVSRKIMVTDRLTKAIEPKPFKVFQTMIGMH